jgi:predicted DCC family thiol-disulfide oxidoreductase YuxK
VRAKKFRRSVFICSVGCVPVYQMHPEEQPPQERATDSNDASGFSSTVEDVNAEARQHVLLYDNECSMCTFQMKVLSHLDWKRTLRLTPLSDPIVPSIAPSLTPEALSEAIHCVTPEGKIHRGARAIRFIGMRLPLLTPVALVLWFPGVIFVAEIIYKWISRNRYVLSRMFGCKTACGIIRKKD